MIKQFILLCIVLMVATTSCNKTSVIDNKTTITKPEAVDTTNKSNGKDTTSTNGGNTENPVVPKMQIKSINNIYYDGKIADINKRTSRIYYMYSKDNHMLAQSYFDKDDNQVSKYIYIQVNGKTTRAEFYVGYSLQQYSEIIFDENGDSTEIRYDAKTNLKVLQYTFDKRGNMKKLIIYYNDGSIGTTIYNNTYNEQGNLLKQDTYTNNKLVSSYIGTFENNYVVKYEVYSYNNDGNILTYNIGTYTYDDYNNPKTVLVKDDKGIIITSWSYTYTYNENKDCTISTQYNLLTNQYQTTVREITYY